MCDKTVYKSSPKKNVAQFSVQIGQSLVAQKVFKCEVFI